MKISVTICTFNGVKFLREQLASISTQTHLPSEMVFYDDGSGDATVSRSPLLVTLRGSTRAEASSFAWNHQTFVVPRQSRGLLKEN